MHHVTGSTDKGDLLTGKVPQDLDPLFIQEIHAGTIQLDQGPISQLGTTLPVEKLGPLTGDLPFELEDQSASIHFCLRDFQHLVSLCCCWGIQQCLCRSGNTWRESP